MSSSSLDLSNQTPRNTTTSPRSSPYSNNTSPHSIHSAHSNHSSPRSAHLYSNGNGKNRQLFTPLFWWAEYKSRSPCAPCYVSIVYCAQSAYSNRARLLKPVNWRPKYNPSGDLHEACYSLKFSRPVWRHH